MIQIRTYLALMGVIIFWGVSFVATKMALAHADWVITEDTVLNRSQPTPLKKAV